MNKKTISLLKQLTVLTLSDELQWNIVPLPFVIPTNNKRDQIHLEASTRFYDEKRKFHQIEIKHHGVIIDGTLHRDVSRTSVLKKLMHLLKLKSTKYMLTQLYGESVT